MAKGQYLSAYQQGIVRRFYANRDALVLARLSELVSELYLAQGKSADRLWARATETMLKAGAEPGDVEKITGPRDVAALAGVVSELHRGGARASAGPTGGGARAETRPRRHSEAPSPDLD